MTRKEGTLVTVETRTTHMPPIDLDQEDEPRLDWKHAESRNLDGRGPQSDSKLEEDSPCPMRGIYSTS